MSDNDHWEIGGDERDRINALLKAKLAVALTKELGNLCDVLTDDADLGEIIASVVNSNVDAAVKALISEDADISAGGGNDVGDLWWHAHETVAPRRFALREVLLGAVSYTHLTLPTKALV